MLSCEQLGGGEDESLKLLLSLAPVIGVEEALSAEDSRLDVVDLVVAVDLDGYLESLRGILDILLGHHPAKLSHRNMEGLDSAILTELSLTAMLGLENVEINHSNYLPDQDLTKVLGSLLFCIQVQLPVVFTVQLLLFTYYTR